MGDIQFTTVDRLFAKFSRELKGTSLSESDVIEWSGEALDFMKMPEIQDQAVSFIEVKNHEAVIPNGFQMVLQMARYNNLPGDNCNYPPKVEEKDIDLSCPDCCPVEFLDCAFNEGAFEYRPYFDMQWQYIDWSVSRIHRDRFTPVRLANHTLFNSLVCKEKSMYCPDCNTEDEYTIVGTADKKFRFSFESGIVALSYIKTAVDNETGYPLIPDTIQHITAISYYVKWKIAEWLDWNGREGFGRIKADNERLWLKYVKQAKNYAKMPKSLDQFQNMMETTHHLIPRQNRYYKFFGKLGRAEQRRFNDPNFRNNTLINYYGKYYN